MRRWRVGFGLLVTAPWLMSAAPAADDGAAILSLVRRNCFPCHNAASQAGGLSLAEFDSADSVVAARATWERVFERVDKGQMPPAGARPMRAEDREKLLGWLHDTLYKVDCTTEHDPGRVTIRRLNRAEYNNTIRDLFGLKIQPADEFPYDDVGYGFDNIGDVLSLPVLLMEKYLAAAERITELAIDARDPAGERQRIEAESLGEVTGAANDGGALNFYTNGTAATVVTVGEGGRYALRFRGWGQQAGPDPCRVALSLNGRQVALVEVPETAGAPKIGEVMVQLAAGPHTVAAAFTNDYYNPEAADERQRDRNFQLDWLELQGPILDGPRSLPEAHKRLLTARPADDGEAAWLAAARAVLEPFGRRCWRRPLAPAELDSLARISLIARRDGDTFERGIQLAVQAMLISPHFLFRVELDQADSERLDDWQIASRLSYFLWASLPDEPLFAAAAAGRLHEPAQLAAQVRRMLADPKALALTENFAAQWLQLRRLEEAQPDRERFPEFDDELRQAMRLETELFFAGLVREDRSVLEFLGADYTYLNERLAAHYGIPGVRGPHFRKVPLRGEPGRQRGGVLTQASILTVTSNPTRTSPVKRGKFVLENVLGAPPPDPPPGTPALPDDREAILTGTVRQRLERHRADPNCAVCHVEMDAIGFGFENYDPVGAWRTKDGEFAIDPAGELPGGRRFADGRELRWLLAKEQDQFVRCLAEKLLTYALGRGLEYYDRCVIDEVAAAAKAGDYRFSSLVSAIARSDAFLRRRAERSDNP